MSDEGTNPARASLSDKVGNDQEQGTRAAM